MTHLKVREYHPEDFLEIKTDGQEAILRSGKPLEWWAKFKTKMPSVTIVDNQNAIVCCCGVHDQTDGVGEAWAVFSPLAKKYPQIFQAIKRLLRFVVLKMSYTKLVAAVYPEWPEAVRLVEHLGFKKSGNEIRHGLEFDQYELVRKDGIQ